MPFTTKLLVVANRTADSDELFDELAARARTGPLAITLLVPQDTLGGQGRRLRAALDRLHEHGIDAQGLLGDADPAVAVAEVWDPRRWDEIVVVTLPSKVSRWLGCDVPQRIARLTDAPVHHLEAAPTPAAAVHAPG